MFFNFMPNAGNCLILGGGGFIGSHVADMLLKRGYRVTIFGKRNSKKTNLAHILDRVKIIEGDFNNDVDVRQSLDRIDYVFHLISGTLPATSNDNPIYDIEINLVNTIRLLNASVERGVKKIIFVSSGGTVYGTPTHIPISEQHPTHPISSYGVVKKAIEDYLFMYHTLYGLDYTVLRLSNPYGERQNIFGVQGAVAVFLRKALNGEPIEIWGDGNTVRDYVYIGDVAEAFVNALETTTAEKIFNIGSGDGRSLNDIINLISTIHGRRIEVKYLPPRRVDIPVNILDISLARTHLNWQPTTPFQDGVKRFYNYLNTQRYAQHVG
jgi:UDP-glucose 4-epimerase